MTPDQMQGFMLKLAEAANGSTSNQVVVYRQVLTDVYRIGHDAGMRDARRDEWVRDTIDREFPGSDESATSGQEG
ncbi:MAG: hypothetical protein JWO57_794 [Pseudonocardiales bacterium]|nr:hypothetical protein [Pseudonocardiales bacterium]